MVVRLVNEKRRGMERLIQAQTSHKEKRQKVYLLDNRNINKAIITT